MKDSDPDRDFSWKNGEHDGWEESFANEKELDLFMQRNENMDLIFRILEEEE